MMVDVQEVYEAAWKLLYLECASEETKVAMRETLARAFEEKYQEELREEAERRTIRESNRVS